MCLLIIHELQTNIGVRKAAGIYPKAEKYYDIRDVINSQDDALIIRVCPTIKDAEMQAKAEGCRYIAKF